jgi:hypothetical protein
LFVVTLPISAGYHLPKEFEQADFGGLELLALLEKERNVGRLVMFWANHSFYRTVYQRLASALSLDLHQAETFYVTDGRQQEPSPRFWARTAVLLVGIGAFATLCANLKDITEGFGNLYRHVFADPNVKLLATDEPSIDAIEGEKKIIEIECHNYASVPCTLTLDPVHLEPQDSSRILYNSKTRLPEIGVGEGKKFSIVLILTEVRDYKVTIIGNEHAGILHGNVMLKPTILSIKVWAAIDNSPAVALSRPLGLTAEFFVTAKHGRPPTAGIRYDATLNPADDLEIVGVSEYIFDKDKYGNVSALSWHDDKAEGFKNKTYILFLKGDKTRDESEWKKIESRISVSVGANS